MAQKNIKIGLEIHGYLSTKEKLFCNCKAVRHAAKQDIKPNTFICPICTGQPGCKPMLPNEEAIKKIIQIGLILGCKINEKFAFQRKHYSWPDLPKGYQDTISGAYSIPICENGKFEDIKINEAHLEEDPASWNPETGCIDYNRSGLPLVEIVTAPEFKSSSEVESWLNSLVLALSYIKAVDSNAGLKADVNISINKKEGQERVEVKNITSIQDIKKAIEYEIKRQSIEGTKRETRRYDSIKNITIKMREKEQAEDYRFIPDPDLPLIKLEKKRIRQIESQMPETPQEKLNKLIKKHKLEKSDAEILYKNLELVEFFEKVAEKIKPKEAIHWITIELKRVLNYSKKTLDEVEIEAEHFIELLEAVIKKEITELKAKQILNSFIPKSYSIKSKLKKEGKIESKEIEEICKKIIKQNQKAVQDYLQGNQQSINFLIGEVMKASDRRADYKTAKELLLKMLK